jgi:hypothetical protein
MNDLTTVMVVGFGVIAFLLWGVISAIGDATEAVNSSKAELGKIAAILQDEISWKGRDESLSFRRDLVEHLDSIEGALGYRSDLLKELRDIEKAVQR